MVAALLTSCSDDDSFSTSSGARLTFAVDTVRFDTVFSTVPTATKSFWVYNNSGDGLRIQTAQLEHGNQNGYRVNIDGTFLDNTTGSISNNFEVRKGDSIRVFVELTSPTNGGDGPQLIEDNIVFTLESGAQQKVCLSAYSWDAQLVNSLVVSNDTTIASQKPIVIYGGIKVDSAATLTIEAPTKLYFHDGAGVDVFGRLVVNGTATDNVVFRGDRTDRMFDYLPYDRVSGQWGGVRFHSSSTGNTLTYADIHSGSNGITCDSTGVTEGVSDLVLSRSTVHNCKGVGVSLHCNNVLIENCQISNTYGDCLAILGGSVSVVNCTLAQFYPFSYGRGAALRFSNGSSETASPLASLSVNNTLITGYETDEIMGEQTDDSTIAYNYHFANSILRTPAITDETVLAHFSDVIFETPEDSVQGKQHFANIDEVNLRYDFSLDSLSAARQRAVTVGTYSTDRRGKSYGDKPDIGCFQY